MLKDLAVFGWGSIIFLAVAAAILTAMKGKDGYRNLDKLAQKEVEQ